ncbi:MAG: eL32 family ribosomal protein [Candidatus Altiarchaeota archaeon]
MTEGKAKVKAAAKKPTEKKAAEKKPAAKTPAVKKPSEKTPKAMKPAKPKEAKTKVEEKKPPEETPAVEEKKPEAKKKPKAPEKKEEPKLKAVHAPVKITNLPPKDYAVSQKTKPHFRRQEYSRPRKTKLEDKWRTPTGIDSKKLEKQRGKGYLPSIGYKKPKAESELHFGFKTVRVFNTKDLSMVDSKKQAAVIASAVGRRKRNMIIEEANKLKITILNPRRGEA